MTGLTHGTGGSHKPWWLTVAVQFGAPTAMLAAVLYWLLVHMDGDLHKIDANVDAHRHNTQLEQSQMLWYMRAACLNDAETDTERVRCIPPEEAR